MSFLKWLRVVLAAIVFVAISALFLDFAEVIPRELHGIAHLQITPAILSIDIGTVMQTGVIILAVWIVLTLLFGRVYCSVMCPFGIMQDLVSRLAKLLRGQKKIKFAYQREMKKTRYSLFLVFVLGLFFVPFIVSILDPYSNYGRVMSWIFRPLYLAGNNFLAATTQAVYFKANHPHLSAGVIAVLAIYIAGVLSFLFGRRYCNTVCPVGTLLGLLSKFSRHKIQLKSDCISCGLCEKTCKGECIDSKNKTVDSSRCVACFNCLSKCKRGSIVYSSPLPNFSVTTDDSVPQREAAFVPIAVPAMSDKSRRRFMQWSIFSFFLSLIGGSVRTARSNTSTDPSLPIGISRVGYKMTAAILPPGASDLVHFRKKCTACHLCVTKCPSNAIVPSVGELGLAGFLQPVLKFDHGFCNENCTICTEVCPSRALTRIHGTEEKHRLQIGRVVFLKQNCVVHTQDSNCGACAEHCPMGAVKMVPYGDPAKSLSLPEVDPDLCLGCGACEYICPVRPYRAIYVDGLEKHGEAKPAFDPNEKQQEVKIDDFGF